MNLNKASTPLVAETKALLAHMQQTWIQGFTSVLFEGDIEVLINTIKGSTTNREIANLLQDIYYWKSKFISAKFNFINRSCNNVAHHLAKYGCNLSESILIM